MKTTIATVCLSGGPRHIALKSLDILYDRDGTAEYFQVYTHTFEDRFFFQIVQRRNYTRFGAANASIRLAAQSRLAQQETDANP